MRYEGRILCMGVCRVRCFFVVEGKMGCKVDNAIIMAAGYSSRFAPISYEMPKGLICVKGEVLIERQIKQLKQSGINDIIVVVGYKKEQFMYLKEKFQVKIIENKEYKIRNNNSSIYVARNYINNSYICSSDNYFAVNPFKSEEDFAYYSAVFSEGKTDEWCISVDEEDIIQKVCIGGENQWYMLGHVFWDQRFSREFIRILEKEYDKEDVKNKLWESIYADNLDKLQLRIKRYDKGHIYEFDTLDELREFDETYKRCSNSKIMHECARKLNCDESEMKNIKPIVCTDGKTEGMEFFYNSLKYRYYYDRKMEKVL